jgi:hypothetical protein
MKKACVTTLLMRRANLALPLLMTGLIWGCGGGKGHETAKAPPPAAQVQVTVATILNRCIKSTFDPNADTKDVSAAIDRQIAFFNQYNPDARLAPSDLKAATMREVLEQTRETIRPCRPEDVDRVNATLASKVATPASSAPTNAQTSHGSVSAYRGSVEQQLGAGTVDDIAVDPNGRVIVRLSLNEKRSGTAVDDVCAALASVDSDVRAVIYAGNGDLVETCGKLESPGS